MIKITFKDVGHGDSIILEWKNNDQNKIALIDCNISDDRRIPTLEYLKNNNTYKEIEFILLSHPHYDHYSGLNKLLEYCAVEGIVIKTFMHTAFTTPKYLIDSAVKSLIAKDELKTLFLTISKLRKKDIIKKQGYITDDYNEVSLSDSIKLKVIAPTTDEFEKYKEKKQYSNDDESCHNNANANLLSTVIKLYSEKWYILLTSDCLKHALEYYNHSNHFKTKDGVLFLGQIPHHGSSSNHNESFWKSLNKDTKSSVIFSCGVNSYNHPSVDVVHFFQQNHYNIEYTNKVGGLLYEDIEIDNVSIELNLISEQIESNNPNYSERGDKVFLIE